MGEADVQQQQACRAVLFDFDGTLVDSAPDLAAAANDMRAARGEPAVDYLHLRAHAGSGARGMLGAAFGCRPADPHYEALRDEFLTRYQACMLERAQLFAGVERMLAALHRHGLPWGIVTNKAMRMAQPMAQHLGLAHGCRVLVAGDTTAHTKPHPAPLLEAARRLQLEPAACVYVGDDPRDIAAGRAAGMGTLAAAWGYLGVELPIGQWGADHVLEQPQSLLHRLGLP